MVAGEIPYEEGRLNRRRGRYLTEAAEIFQKKARDMAAADAAAVRRRTAGNVQPRRRLRIEDETPNGDGLSHGP